MAYIFSILLSFLSPLNSSNPEELGKVKWLRSFDLAIKMSKDQDKPIFILFQEVPGCSTCKNYGNNVLSHPFIVEAIEDEFIPLAIFNNKGGDDRKVLERYNEPTWNNPVVRIVDQNGENIVRRLYSNYSQQGVVESMIDGLLKSNKEVPNYLHQFAEELATTQGQLKESYVSMYCFWTGEKVIGAMKGVAETEAGFMDGKEVVKFSYNPNLVNYEDIIERAGKEKCADLAYTNDSDEMRRAEKVTQKPARKVKSYHSDKQPKYYLSNTIYKYLPMSRYQSAKINAALGKGESAEDFLSPRQAKVVQHIQNNRTKNWASLYQADFVENWWKLYNTLSNNS